MLTNGVLFLQLQEQRSAGETGPPVKPRLLPSRGRDPDGQDHRTASLNT